MTMPVNRRPGKRPAVRDSGIDHAAYERTIGSLVHRLIGQLCRQDHETSSERSLRTIRRLAATAVRGHPISRGRLAVTQQSALGAWAYWRDLVPPATAGFKLVGTEVRIGRFSVDLVWELCDATRSGPIYFFDEIKTGSWHGIPSRRQRSQIESLLEAGSARFGPGFVGIRFLMLSDPAGRFWVTPDRRWIPLAAGWLPSTDRKDIPAMTITVTDFAWRLAFNEIEAARAEHGGTLPVSIRKGMASRLAITDRHLRRLLAAPGAAEGRRDLTDEQLAYLSTYGTATEAHRALLADGMFSGSLSTFRRRVEALGRALYLGIVFGEEEMRGSYVYLRWEASAVDAVWQQDTAWSRTAVLYRGRPVQPSVEFILDDLPRSIMGIGVKAWAPDSTLATRTLAMAIGGQFTPGGRPAKPGIVRHDQGPYYLSDHFTEALSDAHIVDKAVRGRAPYLKGKVERVIRTARVECLNHMPGAFRVPKALGEDPAKLRHNGHDRLLSMEEFTERIERWARWYNDERPHGALGGRTPTAVRLEGAKPSEATHAQAILALLRRPTETRIVSKNGVHWANREYTHPALNGMGDQGIEVQVGPDPNDADALHVYRGRLWLCTARPHEHWKDRLEEFFQARGHEEKHARNIRALGSELRSRGVPSTEERSDAEVEERYDAMLGDEAPA